jgi:two-component system, OmpR family, alkaline phosphatase synthesis response regulator PhoP
VARILLADDSSGILAILGEVLREAGHLVTSTNNGADALCLLSAKPPPELLILDLNMPGLNGHDVIQNLGPSSPPVLVITGDEVCRGDFIAGRVKRVLLKPFDQTQFLEAVNDALKGNGDGT